MEVAIIIAAVGIATIWVMYVNEKTLAQRLNMIHQLHYEKGDDLDTILRKIAYMNRIMSVPYNKHLLYLAVGRDPMRLYKN